MNIKDVDINSIKPNPKNPRKISDFAIQTVAESIKANGFTQPIVIWTDNVIRIGHTRYQAAKRLGLRTVPVLVLDKMSKRQADALMAIDNKTNEHSRWDYALLGELMGDDTETDWTSYFTADEIGAILNVEQEEEDDTDIGDVALPPNYAVIVTCSDELEQQRLYNELLQKGYDCKIPNND